MRLVYDMRDFVLVLAQLTLYTSVTAAMLFLLKRCFRFILSPWAHVAVWAILLVRMMFPILPASEISVYNLIPGKQALFSGAILDEIQIGAAPEKSSGEDYIERLMRVEYPVLTADEISAPSEKEQLPDYPAASSDTVFSALAWVYFAGVTVFLLRVFVQYRISVRRAVCASIPCDDPKILEQYFLAARKLHLRPSSLPVLHMGERSLLCGISRPTLILDHRADPKDIPMILLHELNHFRNRDNWIILCSHVFACFIKIVIFVKIRIKYY